MEMHQLRYVVAVAGAGNFSRAAAQCHVSQPSLSQQILKLEEELGGRLFERVGRRAKPTPRGEVFLGRAERILGEVAAAKREAEESTALVRGRMVIGVLPTIAPYLLPEGMRVFLGKYPGMEIMVQEDTTDHLLELLAACEIDFALVSRPIPGDGVRVEDLFVEKLLLALPSGHRLARRRVVRAADLAGERLIVMKEGHCLGDQVLDFCGRRDPHPSISFRSAQLETVLAMVRAGMGISLIPAMAVEKQREESPEFRSFALPGPSRKIAAAWLERRPPGRAILEFLRTIPRPTGKIGGQRVLPRCS